MKRFVHSSSLKHIWDVQVKFLGIWWPTLEWVVANQNESSENLSKAYKEKYNPVSENYHTTIREMV